MKRNVILLSAMAGILFLTGCAGGSGERQADQVAVSDTDDMGNRTDADSALTGAGQDFAVLQGERADQTEKNAQQPELGQGENAQQPELGQEEDAPQTNREQKEDAERAEKIEQNESGGQIGDFVPEGWELWDSVELDFNADGVSDYVGVLQAVMTDEDGQMIYQTEFPRVLFAIASDGGAGYRLDFQDENVIRKRDEGGVHGDPYQPMTAEGTSFTTHTYGGSAWRWSEDYTYTYREGKWWLASSESAYGYGDYITDYEKNDWESGVGIRKKRSSDWGFMEENIGQAENAEWESVGYDLEYEVTLDAQMTLEQAGKRWWLAPDRVTDWKVEKMIFAEDVDIPEDRVERPDEAYIEYCDENCALYTFTLGSDTDRKSYYLAMYSWQDKVLSVLAAGESEIEYPKFYDGKIYYTSDVVENVPFRKEEGGKKEVGAGENTVGVRLNRMEPDGSDKEVVFEYRYAENTAAFPEGGSPYVSLLYEISGGEIIAEVYLSGEPHPYYRMKTDGSGQERIGQVPG